jgi:hypothetical protein
LNLNVLLRGQSNAEILGRLLTAGGLPVLTAEVQRLLGFDGINDTVSLQFAAQQPDGRNTVVSGTALIGSWLIPTPGGGWQPAALEQGLLGYIGGSMTAAERADPTIVLWLHNEYDSANASLTPDVWTNAVRADAALVRQAFGRPDIPYMFVAPIPYLSGTDAGNQAIRVGMEQLDADPGFNASIGAHANDLDMDALWQGIGGHLDAQDATTIALRAARSLAEAWAEHAKPGSPVALAGGNLADDGPRALQAERVSEHEVAVHVAFDVAAGFSPLEADAAAGTGWTVHAPDGAVLPAFSARVLGPETLLVSFVSPVPLGGALHYGHGVGRLTGMDGGGQGNAVYDSQGMPLWVPATGLTVQEAPPIDGNFYAARYPDVVAAGVDARVHYESLGWREGRDPNAFFATANYLAANPDVRAAGFNPLDHYHAFGWQERRDPSAGFDTSLYLVFNPDVAASGLDPLGHWIARGQLEGRKSSPAVGSTVTDGFDASYYRLANADVALSGADPLAHFREAGWREGRDPNGFFDTSAYLAANPDVAQSGADPLAHYMSQGWREGRDPSSHFDTSAYLAAYPDVAASGINPLQHFLSAGLAEGRSGFGDLF